jgi:hypothetical protein
MYQSPNSSFKVSKYIFVICYLSATCWESLKENIRLEDAAAGVVATQR